jgi:protein-tyrosine phosphatase
MKCDLYWIPRTGSGRLAVAPRPRGGDWLEDEVRSWRSHGVDVVVSLLTSDEAAELDLAQEKELCDANGIQFVAFPIVDRAVPPSGESMRELVARLVELMRDGKSIVIHCRQGIGRSGMVALAVLAAEGMDFERAIAIVSAARGCPVPETAEQQRWLASFVKEPTALASK